MDEPLDVQLFRGVLHVERGLTARTDDWVRIVVRLLEVDVVGAYLLDDLELFKDVGAVSVEEKSALGVLTVASSQGRVEVPAKRYAASHDAVLIVLEFVVARVGLADVGEAWRLQPLRVALVEAVVVASRVGRGIVRVGGRCQRGAAAPAPDSLRR